MEQIVEKILEIEEKAQKLCEDAVYQKEHFRDLLEEDVRRMEKNIREHANKRIRLIYQEEQSYARTIIKETQASYEKQGEQMDALYQQNRDRWEERAFASVIADE